MRYSAVLTRKRLYHWVGYPLFFVSLLLIIISLLKGAYATADQAWIFAPLFQVPIEILYGLPGIPFLWDLVPTFDMKRPLRGEHLPLGVLAMLSIVGTFLIDRARRLGRFLQHVRYEIAKEQTKNSLRPPSQQHQAHIIQDVDISVYNTKEEGYFSKFHTRYLAPFILIIIGIIMGKFFGS